MANIRASNIPNSHCHRLGRLLDLPLLYTVSVALQLQSTIFNQTQLLLSKQLAQVPSNQSAAAPLPPAFCRSCQPCFV